MGILDRHDPHGEDESHTEHDCGQAQPPAVSLALSHPEEQCVSAIMRTFQLTELWSLETLLGREWSRAMTLVCWSHCLTGSLRMLQPLPGWWADNTMGLTIIISAGGGNTHPAPSLTPLHYNNN